MLHLPPFPGFRAEAFQFLRDLSANNNREWFKAHKEIFDAELHFPMQCLVQDVGQRCQLAGIPLIGDAKRGLFRIYRDTRFSANKEPYKTHLGAVVSRDGTTKGIGDLYIHVEPDNSFVGGGFWMPEPDLLKKFRERMADDPEGFLAIREEMHTHGVELMTENPLKRLPKGFEQEANSPVANYLKWKSFFGWQKFPNEVLLSSDFAQHVIQAAYGILPLMRYGWEIMDD